MRKSIERGDSEVGVGPTTPAHADRRKDRSGLIDVSARDPAADTRQGGVGWWSQRDLNPCLNTISTSPYFTQN